MADRTEIEWIVQPPDFFESQYQYQTDEYTVVIDKRRVLVTSFTEKNPLSDSFLDRLSNEIESIFNTRQLQVHKKYTLEGPRIYKYHNNHKNAIIHVGNSVLHLSAPPVDILIQDSAGRMIHDTKSERIAIDKQMLDLIIPNVPRSIELQNMLRSYNSAVNDPVNELVYYYEIREILNTLYGKANKACATLNISHKQWDRLGAITNDLPLKEGRHRGKHMKFLRPATIEELDEARRIVRDWIVTFAKTL